MKTHQKNDRIQPETEAFCQRQRKLLQALRRPSLS